MNERKEQPWCGLPVPRSLVDVVYGSISIHFWLHICNNYSFDGDLTYSHIGTNFI